MNRVFKEAVIDVFEKSFGLEVGICHSRPSGTAMASEIPFELEKRHYKATLFFRKRLLIRMAKLLLEEDHPERETLEDLTDELTNQIIGHAKMLASDRDMACMIATPAYIGDIAIPGQKDTEMFKIDGNCLILQIKETDD